MLCAFALLMATVSSHSQLINTGEVNGTAPSGAVTPQSSTSTVPVAAVTPSIELKKSVVLGDQNGDAHAQIGETLIYSFTVKNTGNVTLKNITISDPSVTVAGGTLASLAPGVTDTTTFTATYTLTATDILAGGHSNQATTAATSAVTGSAVGGITDTSDSTNPVDETGGGSDPTTIAFTDAPIVAVDDASASVNGASGSAIVVNAYNNDTLNVGFVTVDLTKIVGTVTTPATPIGGGPVPVLDVATGIVSVPAGTPAGTYTIDYKICEVLNPTNCDPARITVIVGAALIVADADSVTGVDGATGGADVLDALNGDTLNGSPATVGPIGTVNMAVTTPAVSIGGGPVPSLDPTTGRVSVPAGTPTGLYTITYEICEKLNPLNCASNSITVGVGAALMVAVDDAPASVNGASGSASVVNAYANDTINTALVTVDLSRIVGTVTTPATPIGGGPVPVLDVATGIVSVAAGTPAGTYTIDYKICEVLNPANCDPAKITVLVGMAPIVADADAVSGVNGQTGGADVVDALLGDTLNGVQATLGAGGTVTMLVTVPAVSIGGGPVPALDPLTGKVSVPAGTPAGTYTISYQICEVLNPANCATAAVTVGVIAYPNSISGVVFDDNNSNGVLDPADTRIGGYTVNLIKNGLIVDTVIASADGSYQFISVLPGSGYTIAAVDPATNRVVTGAGSFSVTPGSNIANINLPIDPSGVVYDSVTRLPIAGAVLTMTTAAGVPLPIACFASPAQQSQVTLADGQYRFDIIAGADPLCPIGRTEYRLAVTSPSGYLSPPSTTIAPLAGALNASVCPIDGVPGGSCSVQPQDTPPTGVLATSYYFAFSLAAGDPNIVHNHIPLDPIVIVPGGVTVAKTAQSKIGERGGVMTYTIIATNNSSVSTAALNVIDNMPAGFTLVTDSATLDGVAITPLVNGRSISFPNVTIPATSHVTIVLQLRIPVTAAPGDYDNFAIAVDASTGIQIGTSGKATIRVKAEAVFDCSDIIGKVFDDKNSNGYQDKGELGIPGVRLVTVRGELITTDKNGQYHVPCAMLPDQNIGSNFILKLDTRTLPTGYRITTENPRTVRVTAGKVTKLNFGATIGRVVRLDVRNDAFVDGQIQLKPEWESGLNDLIKVLGEQPSVLRVTYTSAGESTALAKQRVANIKTIIESKWNRSGWDYRLPIEVELVNR